MMEIHYGVVCETTTGKFRLADLNEMPTDAGQPVWDSDTDEWRALYDGEHESDHAVEVLLAAALETLNKGGGA